MERTEFPEKMELNRHNGCHLCCFCWKVFSKKSRLQHHVKECHDDSDSLQCGTCKYSFLTRKDMDVHMKTHTEVSGKEIGKNLFPQWVLTVHLYRSETKEPKSCNGYNTLEVGCTRNVDVNNKPEVSSDKNIVTQIEPSDVQTDETEPVQCTLCTDSFDSIEACREHMQCHVEEKEQLACDVCGKHFSQRAYLTIHKRIHDGISNHTCNVCGACFNSRSNLHKHKATHMAHRQFKCSLCSKSYMTPLALKSHKKSHLPSNIRNQKCRGSAEFRCDVCGRHFARKDYLTDHKRIHTGEKPFKCNVCGSCFTQRNSLRGHYQRIHASKEQCQCKLCHKFYFSEKALQSHMKLHMRTHVSQTSNIQERSLVKQTHQMEQDQVHSDERPFE